MLESLMSHRLLEPPHRTLGVAPDPRRFSAPGTVRLLVTNPVKRTAGPVQEGQADVLQENTTPPIRRF
jgi:hypothetical protein